MAATNYGEPVEFCASKTDVTFRVSIVSGQDVLCAVADVHLQVLGGAQGGTFDQARLDAITDRVKVAARRLVSECGAEVERRYALPL